MIESAHRSMMECDVALVDMHAVLKHDGYTVYGGSSSRDHVLLGEKDWKGSRIAASPTPSTRGAKGEVMTCSRIALALSILGTVGVGVILSMGAAIGTVILYGGRLHFR